MNSIPLPQETSDLETAAVSDPAKPRTAVCVLGAWRSLDQSASSIRQYMLDPLDADAYAVIEAQAEHHTEARCELLLGPRASGRCRVGKPTSSLYREATRRSLESARGCLDKGLPGATRSLATVWLQQDACLAMIQGAQTDYATFAYTRTDQQIFHPLPPAMMRSFGPDEVIVPDFTMVASANAVKLAGAEVVFVDIEADSLCMDFERMSEAVTPRTKAIVLVTVNGRYPARMMEFAAFCRDRGLRLVEDAAQSLGSFKDGRHLGTFGHIGSFSFSAPKVITTGQGGALVTDDDALIERIRLLRDFGRASGGSDHYLTMGWNFKFTDIQAIIGIEQMKKLPWRVRRKKEIYARYRKHLAGTPELELIPTDLEDTAPWFIDVLVANGKREELAGFLKDQGIGARPFYPALHAEPVYARSGSFPVSERVARQGLWLPSSSKVTDAEIDLICQEVARFCTNR